MPTNSRTSPENLAINHLCIRPLIFRNDRLLFMQDTITEGKDIDGWKAPKLWLSRHDPPENEAMADHTIHKMIQASIDEGFEWYNEGGPMLFLCFRSVRCSKVDVSITVMRRRRL